MSNSLSNRTSKEIKPLCNVILVGFMGTGKTSIGKRVAHSLGFDFVDTDELIVESTGKAITEIFSENGEDYFRDIESQMLQSCGEQKNQVIATGGGIVLREKNRQFLIQAGYVIWLKASAEAILERVSRNHARPLLHTANPLQTIKELLQQREALYSSSSDIAIETDDLSIDETSFGICECARVIFADC